MVFLVAVHQVTTGKGSNFELITVKLTFFNAPVGKSLWPLID